jgi:hypothetical protein
MIKQLLLALLLFPFLLQAQYQNIKVNSSGNDPEEVAIAVNPTNTSVLAVGANINYYYISTNSGVNWTQYNIYSNLFGVWGDPTLIFDAEGNLFYGHLSYPPSGAWIDRIVVQKSTDNGTTFNQGSGIGLNSSKKQDKAWLAVDMQNGRNILYTTWTEFDSYGSASSTDSSRILFSKSVDHGVTWSTPLRISTKGGDCLDSGNTDEGAVPTVGPNGEIYDSWAGPLGLVFTKSTDYGVTFSPNQVITSIPGGWNFAVPGIYRCNGLPITVCDTSYTSTRGNVYICWDDQRNGTDNSDVFLVKSTDGGSSWSSVKKVNNDNTTRHQFFPWVTIDQTTGHLFFIFYDRRNTSGSITDVYAAESVDGGETFNNFKISQTTFDPSSTTFFGDYTNIAAFNKKVYPVWMRLDGTTLSVYCAPFTDSATVLSVEPNNLNKISNFLLLQNYPNPFNPSTTISYQIPHDGFVSLKVYDVLGNEIATLVNEVKTSGLHEVNFDASNISSGIYLYMITVNNFTQTHKMIVLK